MPLQHINDRILKSMRRGTNKDSTQKLIARLRRKIPDLAIRTTFIIGYPGETPVEFNELLEFIKEARFERLGVFTYSQEEGSAAAKLEGHISDKEKQTRLEEVMLLQQEISAENNRKLIGTFQKALVEDLDKDTGCGIGRTYMDAPEVDGNVYIKDMMRYGAFKPGQFLNVKITETRQYDLIGELAACLD
jgi:ribosomal protein S12 methylthiotransferase